MDSPFNTRRSGVLLHPSSLPGDKAQGQLNQHAIRFIDFLHDAGFKVWQILPLGPTHNDRSPYQSYSSFALNPELLDPSFCAEVSTESLSTFVNEHRDWLIDYALYRTLKSHFSQTSWLSWPAPLRDRDTEALETFARAHTDEINAIYTEQYQLSESWHKIKRHASERQIKIFGDLPIFVSHDSADVWANRTLFKLNHEGRPDTVSGVPPDYFSVTGQRWGNPHYHWDRMAQDGFVWWRKRMARHLALFDWVRIDHFRGLEAFWVIPGNEPTAINGHWEKGPGSALLEVFRKDFLSEGVSQLPIIAEDLGIITPEVNALRQQFNLPGMKILQFAFDSDARNPYLPHRHVKNCIVYTGTHDNDTTLGWFSTLNEKTKERCLSYLSYPKVAMPEPLVRSALASMAHTAIIPMQDMLALDGSHRMNTPGTTENNWRWRFQWQDLPSSLASQYREMNALYGR